ncbi:MAG: type II toxin-antitoxin system VapC family toxin [Acidobacteria bacterium]|nr:type II toxin-antitoxin system VapC family toxin [Acidobacteriota bacterium]
MRHYLLDTHLILWWLADDPALSHQARRLISSPENIIFVSAVNQWEFSLKQSLDKLRLPPGFDEALADADFEQLSLTFDDARHIAGLPWLHKDPFDRMLIAQARARGMTLLTADQTVAAYGEGIRLVA